MKYIMFGKLGRDGQMERIPVIFPDRLVHSQVSLKILAALPRGFAPISAGSVNLGEIETHGKSDTLKLSPMDDDANVIATYDYLHGMVDNVPPSIAEVVGLKPRGPDKSTQAAFESMRQSIERLDKLLARVGPIDKRK